MKVAVLTSLWPFGARPREGIFAARRWSSFAARGHRVRVVHPLPFVPLAAALWKPSWTQLALAARRERREGLEVERPRYLHLPRSACGNAARFARRGMDCIADWPDSEQPEVLVCDYAWPAAAAAPLAARRELPCVISGRGSDVLQVAGEAGLGAELAAYLRAAGNWLAVSQDLVDAMDRLAQAPGRGKLLPNGVDDALFAPRDRAAARRALGLEAVGALLLCVGHWIERKDPLLALESFAAAQARMAQPARLVYIGRGPLEERLRARVRELGLESAVELRAEVEAAELAQWYAAASLLVLTSKREGRPNVVLEALASGLPVLATRAGGTEELLAADARMLASERDVGALAERMLDLCARPPRPELLSESVAHLRWHESAAALESYLEGVVAANGREAR